MRGIFATAAAVLLAVSPYLAAASSSQRNPLNYLTRVEAPVLHSPSNRIHAYSRFELTFTLHGNEKVRLSLEPNNDVVADDTHVNYLDADGNVARSERIVRTDHRVFKGAAFRQSRLHNGEWINSGWARIVVHRDGSDPIFEGSFQFDGDNHHVQTSTNFRRTQHQEDPVVEFSKDEFMVAWRDSDIMPDAGTHDELKRSLNGGVQCASDDLDYNTNDEHPVYRGLDVRTASTRNDNLLFGRQIDGTAGGSGAGVNLAGSIGSTQGCPTTRKIALVGIATDCTYRADFDSEQAMRTNIINLVSTASQLYESTFNITLGIANLTVNDASCPGTAPASAQWNIGCNANLKLSDRLGLFSVWRGQYNDRNAYWTLLTKCAEQGGAVGIAWLGELCNHSPGSGNSTTNGANVVARIASSEWQIFAHESGHTFGAVHDCMSQTCADGTSTKQQCCPLSATSCDAGGQFIMNPSASSGITRFSACTVGNICSGLLRNSVNGQCLSSNRDVTTISGSQCGNGIVESGEQCDCGGTSGCANNSCCDPATCRFRTNAVCDPSNEECCTAQCRFAGNGTVCRASTGACDPAETCPGTSGLCPADVSAPDGQDCGSGLSCASGQCTSRDLQCRTIVGARTSNNDTTACNSRDCVLTCASPQLGPNTCYNLNQYFLNGTPCGGSGRCSNGQCQGSDFGSDARTFFQDNKNIIIPVASAVGGLILIAVLCCIWSCCRRRRRASKYAASHPPVPPPSWAAANLARPPAAARGGYGGRQPMSPSGQQFSAWQENQQYGGVRRVNTNSRYA